MTASPDRIDREIELIGTTSIGMEVRVYRTWYKQVPVIEIYNRAGGRVTFPGINLIELWPLLERAARRIDELELDHWIEQQKEDEHGRGLD